MVSYSYGAAVFVVVSLMINTVAAMLTSASMLANISFVFVQPAQVISPPHTVKQFLQFMQTYLR